jgi:hypothetical protein
VATKGAGTVKEADPAGVVFAEVSIRMMILPTLGGSANCTEKIFSGTAGNLLVQSKIDF